MKIVVARTFWARFKGLMFRKDMPCDEGLLIERCNSIHTCFMRFPIDAVFYDKRGGIVKEVKNIKPWRWCVWGGWKAVKVLETKARTAFLCALCGFALCAGAEIAPIRLAYNYCTLSYTFAYYSDKDWEAEVERLASAGYNTALLTDGTFKVWQLTLRDLGVPEKDIFAFLPDECARAWWLMGNLTGEGGPIDEHVIEDDARRGRLIATMMRSRGIEPVLQGFTGMMPLSWANALPQGKWSSYDRPPVLDPTSPEYARIAALWYANLEKVYGFKPKFLAGDLFHEGGNTHGIDVTAATKCVQAAQQAAFPGVVWIVQAWQENPTKEVRAALDPNHTLIEALVLDMGIYDRNGDAPMPDFGPLPWIWCEVLNFGGNHGLYGNLATFARMGKAAASPTFRGYGALSEGFFTNPVCQALFEEMMRSPKGTILSDEGLNAWLMGWIAARYGVRDKRLEEAWRILAGTVYACKTSQQGTVENVICAEPSWNANNASTWGPKDGLWYEPEALEKAATLFDEVWAAGIVPEASEAHSRLRFDRYDVKRQVFANHLRSLVPALYNNMDARERFIGLTEDWLAFSRPESGNLPPEFDLSREEARARTRAGERGVKAFHRMITTWCDPAFGRTSLADYSNREYPALIERYYLPRWRLFLSRAGAQGSSDSRAGFRRPAHEGLYIGWDTSGAQAVKRAGGIFGN